MPKLPDTLGALNIPRASNGIARVDTSSAIGIREQGFQSALQGIAGGVQQVQTANDTSELANAQSQFLQAKVAADNGYNDDKDWQTIPTRYGAQVDKARNDSAQMISNPTARNQFLRDSALETQRGSIQIGQLAKSKEGDQGRANLIVGLNNNINTASVTSDTNTRAGLLSAMGAQIDSAVGKGYLDQEGGAKLKIDYGNQYIAQRQNQLMTTLNGQLNTIVANTDANPDINAAIKSIDQASAQYAGSLPADKLTEVTLKAKNLAFETMLKSDNISAAKAFQTVHGQLPLNTVPPQAQPTQQLMDRITSVGEYGKTGARNAASGALGRYQVLPSTAREVAAQIGVPYDPIKLQYDDAYGRQIATAYMGNMLTKFNGNVTLATAAYNGGPARVDDWIRQYGDPRTGNISDAQFTAYIPFDETRAYVGRVVGGMAVPNQQISDPILKSAVAQYPRLAKYAQNTVVVQKQNPAGDDRMLESYPPWESENPNPGKQTTELYTGGTDAEKGTLVAGDMLHYIGGIDPRTGKPVDAQFHAFKDQLIKSLTPDQLKGERAYYNQTKDSYGGSTRTFDQWMEGSRADELMMGYLTPDKSDSFKHYYSPQQKQILDQAKSYLQQADQQQSDTATNITQIGGNPADMPRYNAIIDAKRNREDSQNEAQWNATKRKLSGQWDSHIASLQSTGKGTLTLSDYQQSLSPDDYAELEQQQNQALQINGAVQPIVVGTPQEAADAIDKLRPVGGDPDFASKQKAYETATTLRDQRIEGLQKDPAAYVLQNDPSAADAAAEIDNLDMNDPEQATQAKVDLDIVRSSQRRLGVPDDQIKPLTEARASAIGMQLMTAEPAKVTALLDQYSSTYGADGTKQILAAKGVAPGMRYIAMMGNPADAVLRQRAVMAAQMPHDDLVNGMKLKSITEDQVRKAVDAVVPQALANRPGWASYETGMTNTAMSLIGQGMSQDQAIDAVYAPWKRQYNTTDSLSVPTTYDIDKVTSGLDGAVQNLSKFDIDPKGGGVTGVSYNWTVEQTQQSLKLDHVWATTPDETGAILTYGNHGDGLPGAPVMLKNGQRLIVKFADAEAGSFGRVVRGHPRAGGPLPPIAPAPVIAPTAPVTKPAMPSVPVAPTAPRAPRAPRAPVAPTVQ